MILTKIKLGFPNIWINTQDSFRIMNQITSDSSRDYYTIDIVNGFSKYVDGSFQKYLIKNPAYEIDESLPPFHSPFDPLLCVQALKEIDGPKTFILLGISDCKDVIMSLLGHLFLAKKEHYDLFWSNDILRAPIQFVIISDSNPPEEYLNLFNVLEDSYPTPEELLFILSHISSTVPLEEDVLHASVKAGLGLTESDFIETCLTSLYEHKTIDPKYIYDHKMSSIKRHGILEIIQPKISFNDIGGLDNIKDIVRRTVNIWQNRQHAASMGIKPIRRILMIGIPGTGKSAICQATAKELGLDLARTGISQVMNSFIGQSERNMRDVFSQIKAMSPLCVWIDEFGRDLSGGSSSSHVDGGTTDRVHGEFLTGLQELPEETFLMCAANSLDALRPEMLRADRFDKIMFVGLPSHDERKHIFEIYLRDINTDHEFDYDRLAQASQFMTGAEISSLIQETKFYVTGSELRPINTDDIINCIPSIKNTIWLKHTDMVISMYQTALQQWDWASTAQMDEAKYVINQTVPSSSKSTKKPTYVWKS